MTCVRACVCVCVCVCALGNFRLAHTSGSFVNRGGGRAFEADGMTRGNASKARSDRGKKWQRNGRCGEQREATKRHVRAGQCVCFVVGSAWSKPQRVNEASGELLSSNKIKSVAAIKCGRQPRLNNVSGANYSGITCFMQTPSTPAKQQFPLPSTTTQKRRRGEEKRRRGECATN